MDGVSDLPKLSEEGDVIFIKFLTNLLSPKFRRNYGAAAPGRTIHFPMRQIVAKEHPGNVCASATINIFKIVLRKY